MSPYWPPEEPVDLTREEQRIAAAIEAEARPLFAWLVLKIMRAELDGEGWGDEAA